MTYGSNEVRYGTEQEGKATRAVEARTSRAPSLAFLVGAAGAMAASAALLVIERSQASSRWIPSGSTSLANFVGQWAPSLLIIGLYNKVVKLEREIVGLR